MYCVASIGELDTFWRYKVFSEAQKETMQEFIRTMAKEGYLIRVYKQIPTLEVL